MSLCSASRILEAFTFFAALQKGRVQMLYLYILMVTEMETNKLMR